MYDWLIIGGGIHGVTMAAFLLKSGRTTIEKLAIIDPYPSPLWKWKQNTARINMSYLRSPSVHHLDTNPFDLEKFAKSNSYSSFSHFYGRYDRPSLSLFNDHCDQLCSELLIQESWIQGKVCELTKNCDHWKVRLESKTKVVSKRVVLAMGLSEQPYYPKWAAQLKQEGVPISHMFEEKLPEQTPPITIVGGGITAAHYALKIANEHPGKVTLLCRHPFRVYDFDSDPGWLGPKNMQQFLNTACYTTRRSMIMNARHKGSVTKELYTKLLHLQKKGKLSLIRDEVESIHKVKNSLLIELKNNSSYITNTVVLTTGFIPSLPEANWLTNTINNESLPCAPCGYPIVSRETLEWKENLFVMGPLAELEIGPVSRNIAGARKAAECILNSCFKTPLNRNDSVYKS
jgi:thioredoxin reductase